MEAMYLCPMNSVENERDISQYIGSDLKIHGKYFIEDDAPAKRQRTGSISSASNEEEEEEEETV